MKNLQAKVDKHPEFGVPKRIYEIESKMRRATPKVTALKVLKKIASDLKINPNLSQLKFEEIKETVLGSHVLFQQQEAGKPISGAWVRVDIDKTGKVYNIQNDLVPSAILLKASKESAKKGKSSPQQIDLEEAKEIALEAAKIKGNTKGEVIDSELTWYSVDNIPILSWKVIVSVKKPLAEWKFYIDVFTKRIVKKINLLKGANGLGKIFDPNPIVRLNGLKIKKNSLIPDEAYVEVKLTGLKNSGFLDGQFVTTKKTAKRIKRTSLIFTFKREDRAFREVMVYYHIDSMQRYLQKLGFANLLNKQIAVDVDGETTDNSFYIPSSKSLLFGTGDVYDAEDAEVIIHEYGHAIQDAQVPGFGSEGEARAMGEGFGDYLAASFFASKKPEDFLPTFGSWDAYFGGKGSPRCLRRLDSTKKYPKDMKHEEHHDGEIWSSCLWKIRQKLGGELTDKLVIAHHYLLNPKATFADAAKALITADNNLNKGANEKEIRNVFVERGILSKKK
ncbi:MAG TPA: M36 family metallopeptidase [Bacteroidia bacterium]|nr:M36 family metallopeptidase [Bacteroidia bacterium]HRH07583.1 M36 family metallopeptidase [Bacteroidia bacterium]